MTTTVLCTFGAAYAGGTLRVVTDGLPHLNKQPGIQLAFGDLYEREEIKSALSSEGVRIAEVGVGCLPYITLRKGFRREVDRVRALPSLFLIAHRLRRAAKAADVLYVHTRKELVLAAWSLLPPQTRVQIVWHCHGLNGSEPFMARLAGACRAVIAISATTAERLRAIGVPGERVVTVLNAIDADRVRGAAETSRTPLPACAGAPVVLIPTAQICAHKGIHLLLEAAEAVPDVQIWVTGDMQDPATAVYARQVRELALSPRLRRRVHFLGFRKDIYYVMRAADIICIPSIWQEPFGLVAAEAMALGKPVLVSNRGALPQIVRHGETGIVFDPDKMEDLTDTLRMLIRQPRYAARLGENGPGEVRQRFSYERWACEVAAVLKNGFRR